MITLQENKAKPLPFMGGDRLRPNGISCPICNKELLDSIQSKVMKSNPPKINIECSFCAYEGIREIAYP